MKFAYDLPEPDPRQAARSKRPTDDVPAQEPMRGSGVRRKPSADQKKVRRQIQRDQQAAAAGQRHASPAGQGRYDGFNDGFGGDPKAPKSTDPDYLRGYEIGWEMATDPLHEDGYDPQRGERPAAPAQHWPSFLGPKPKSVAAAYRDDPEAQAWYQSRENVTYTDGTPVHEGDHIRFHQAPGGLMSPGPWQYGVAAYLPASYDSMAARELHLLADDGRYYTLYGHVIERADAATKESTMQSFQQREAEILRQMTASTDLAEQRRLAVALEQVRGARTTALQDERDLDLSATVIRDTLTPIAVYERHTAATDWITEQPTGAGDYDHAMRTSATLWFSALHPAVAADTEEFSEQALGMARREAGRYGEDAPAAGQVFLDTAVRLRTLAAGAGPSGLGDRQIDADQQNGNAESTVTDYDRHGETEPFDDDFWAGDETGGASGVHPPLPGAGEGPQALGSTRTAVVHAPSSEIIWDGDSDHPACDPDQTLSGSDSTAYSPDDVTCPECREALWLDGDPYTASRRTATRYCTTHQVYVGPGNADTHSRDSCNVETRKAKDSARHTAAMPNVDDIMAWENGEMDEDQEVEFFQSLIDSGLAWSLQGMYGRRASDLIDAGLCHTAAKTAKDDLDRAVEQAIWDPRNERSDGLRAGAEATCGTCGQRLTLVGVGQSDSSVLDYQWRHVVGGNPTSSSDHTPVPVDAHNFSSASRTAAEGQTCSVCGDKIAKDPAGEDNSTWHHDNGEVHDHEAKPASSGSKESSLRVTAARPIYEIAADIKKEWGQNVNYAAKPYLDAMMYLNTIDDNFGEDKGAWVLAYFLSNAASFRGEKAKALKAELKAIQKGGSKTAEARPQCPDHPDRTYNPSTGDCSCGSNHHRWASPWNPGGQKKAYYEGDTGAKAICAMCGKPIEMFDGAWYHLSADGPVDWATHGPQTYPGKTAAAEPADHEHRYTSWGNCSVCGKTKPGTHTEESGFFEASRRSALRHQASPRRRRPDTFSLSDAKNEDGEWTMSPEQIRSEMYASDDPGDAQDDWYEDDYTASLSTPRIANVWSQNGLEALAAGAPDERGEGERVTCSCGFSTTSNAAWQDHIFAGPDTNQFRSGHERVSSRTAAETIDPNAQNGNAVSSQPQVEVGDANDKPMWPVDLPGDSEDPATGQGAANVAGVPTPGGESGYPQPTAARVAANYPVECYSCGAKFDNPPTDGGSRKCPKCGSFEVWTADAGKNWGKSSAQTQAFRARVQAGLRSMAIGLGTDATPESEAGYAAAKNGDSRDGQHSKQWLAGYDQYGDDQQAISRAREGSRATVQANLARRA